MKSMRRGTLSRQVLLSVLSVVLISFLFLTCVVSYWSYQQMVREYNQVLQDYASGINSDFSRKMEMMGTLAEEYYNAYNVRIMKDNDFPEPGDNATLIGEVKAQMEPFYHSVLFLNSKGRVCFDTRKGISFVTRLRENIEQMAVNQDLGSRPFLWTAKNRYENEADINMLSIYVQRAPVGEKYYSGSVIINVDTRYLSEALFEDFKQEKFEVFIMDRNGHIVAHSDTSFLGQDISKEPHIFEVLSGDSKSNHKKIGENRMDMFYQNTDYEGFYVVVQSKYSGEIMEALGDMPLSLLLIDFVVSIVLIYLLCNRLFHSFNNVTAHMRNAFENEYEILHTKEPEVEENEESGQHMLIVNGTRNVEKLYDDVQFLEKYHQLTRSYVNNLRIKDEKNLIIKSLLQDTWNQEMQRFLIEKEMVIQEKRYAVAILQINVGESLAEEHIDTCMEQRRIVEDVVSACMDSATKCTCLELGLRKLLLILQEPEGKEGGNTTEESRMTYSVTDSLEDIKGVLQRNHQITVQYSVSDFSLQEKVGCDVLYKQAIKRLYNHNPDQIEAVQQDKQEKSRVKANTNQKMLERVIDYLNNNYQNSEINVSNLADQFHINNAYLGKLFQEFTGQSISSYLLDVRMKRAKDLLMTCPDMSVAQVAREVGFVSNAYFTTSFRKYYGVSPSKIWEFHLEEAQGCEK